MRGRRSELDCDYDYEHRFAEHEHEEFGTCEEVQVRTPLDFDSSLQTTPRSGVIAT
jgi:hypothetical protein